MTKKQVAANELFKVCLDGDFEGFQTLTRGDLPLTERFYPNQMTALQVTLLLAHDAPPSIKKDKIKIYRALAQLAPEKLVEKNADGETVAHFMAMYGFDELIPDLHANHPGLFFLWDNRCQFPLSKAILNHQVKTVETLLDLDPSMSALTDAQQRTMIHYAVEGLDMNMLLTCLKYGPHLLRTENGSQQSPLEFAIEINAPRMLIDELEARSARNGSAL